MRGDAERRSSRSSRVSPRLCGIARTRVRTIRPSSHAKYFTHACGGRIRAFRGGRGTERAGEILRKTFAGACRMDCRNTCTFVEAHWPNGKVTGLCEESGTPSDHGARGRVWRGRADGERFAAYHASQVGPVPWLVGETGMTWGYVGAVLEGPVALHPYPPGWPTYSAAVRGACRRDNEAPARVAGPQTELLVLTLLMPVSIDGTEIRVEAKLVPAKRQPGHT